MARSKPTEETIEKVLAALLEDARANKKLPELLTRIVEKLRHADPQLVDAALMKMIEAVAEALPEGKRHKFLEELLAFMQPE